MNLYNQYRPKDFDEMVGESIIIENLKSIISSTNKSHVYLFTGPPGCGKTTAALICANKYIKTAQIIEINSANNRGIDIAREIIENIKGKPIIGTNWVYIIDEVHETTKDWQDAMLKPLENVPEYVYFFLCTTNPEKLKIALKNRCSIYNFKSIENTILFRLVNRISRKENKNIEEEILHEIAIKAKGSARSALIMLEKIFNVNNSKDAMQIIKTWEDDEIIPDIGRLCRLLLDKEVSWSQLCLILNKLNDIEVETIRRGILGYMATILLKQNNRKVAIIMESFLDPFYNTGRPGLIYACYQAINM